MYKVFEIVVLFGISRISYLRLQKVKEQRDEYLSGVRWVSTVTGNPKEDRESGYKQDIFMSKVGIILSSLIGVYALIKLVRQLFNSSRRIHFLLNITSAQLTCGVFLLLQRLTLDILNIDKAIKVLSFLCLYSYVRVDFVVLGDGR